MQFGEDQLGGCVADRLAGALISLPGLPEQHRGLRRLNNREVFSHRAGGWKPKVSGGLPAEDFLLGSEVAL